MMRKTIAAALIAASAATAACSHEREEGAGPMVSRSFPVSGFDKVEAAGPFDVAIRTGAAPSVQARGNQSLIDRLEVVVEDGELRIKTKNKSGWFGWHHNRGKAVIDITVPSLQAATLAGAGDITIDKVQGDRFEGQLAGAGDLRIDALDVQKLKLGLAGAGSAVVRSGKAGSADYEIAGSGDVDTSAVPLQDLRISIAGAGSVKAQATGTADVSIMGSGDVGITGGAKCSVSKMGAGDVRCS
jgi:hypothetical protein